MEGRHELARNAGRDGRMKLAKRLMMRQQSVGPLPKLMISMMGTQGSTTFVDAMGHTVNRAAPIYVIAGAGPGPQGIDSYAYCPIGSPYTARPLLVPYSPDFIIGSSDFCVDFFINWVSSYNDTQRYEPAFIYWPGVMHAFHHNSKLYMSVSSGGVAVALFNNIANPVANSTWNYFRFSKSGNIYRIYVNTQKIAQNTGPSTVDNTTNTLDIIGAAGLAGVRCAIGMSHFRFFVGTALDTADTIVVPTLPYSY